MVESTNVSNSRRLDHQISYRQAVGTNAIGPRNPARKSHELLKGRLWLPPHGTWEFSEPIDWTADPFSDRNWCFQFHGLRWLNVCRQEAFRGDQEASSFWVRTVVSWIQGNPIDDPPTKWSWINMAEALRALEMVYGLPLAEGDDKKTIVDSLEEHGDWLFDDQRIVGGNHGLHQHQGLFVLGCLFRRDTWKVKAIERLQNDFYKAFDSQGMNTEGAVSYHLLNLKWWRLAWQRLSIEGIDVPDDVEERLTAATLLLHYMQRPDGKLEQIGDTDEAAIGRDDAKSLSLDSHRPATESTEVLLDAGYLFGRSGWGDRSRGSSQETFYSVRFGPVDSYHAHDDTGSVTFHSRGQQWLTDSGRYSYQPNDPIRQYVRSREAHNLLMIDGASRNYIQGGQVISFSSDADAVDLVLADRTYQSNVIQRRVIYVRGIEALIVLDDVSEVNTEEAEQLWHFPPNVSIERYGRDLALTTTQRAASMYSLDRNSSLNIETPVKSQVRGLISTEWKVAVPGGIVSKRPNDRANTLGMMLLSHPKSTIPKVRFRSDRGSPVTVAIEFGGGRYDVDLSGDRVKLSTTGHYPSLLDSLFKLESEHEQILYEIEQLKMKLQ